MTAPNPYATHRHLYTLHCTTLLQVGMRLALLVAITLTYPLQLFPVVELLEQVRSSCSSCHMRVAT